MYLAAYFDQQDQRVYLWDDHRGQSSFPYRDYAYVKSKSSVATTFSIFGDGVKKVRHWTKQDEQDGNVFESDVPVLTRVLVDEYYETDEPPKGHRAVIIDIEVSAEGGFPNMEDADKDITAVSLCDCTSNKYYTWAVNRFAPVTENLSTDTTVVTFVQTEEELIAAFYQKWAELRPTIVSGWNIAQFDIPYLFRRTKRLLGEDVAKMLSPVGLIEWKEFREQYAIAGVSVLDYLGLYKKFTYTQESSYNLDAIGRKEVNMGKVKYEGSLDNLFRTDIQKFVEYNLTDVRIVRTIDEKMKLIDLVIFLCHKAHVPYEDVYYTSRVIEGAMLTHMHRLKIVAPNKPFRTMDDAKEDGAESFSGAFVKEPTPGRYDWIYDLDMTSLYPSVIMTLNISPETKMGRVQGWDALKFVNGSLGVITFVAKEGRTRRMSKEELADFLETHAYAIAANGVVYRTDSVGLVPSILDAWFRERMEFKNLMKKFGQEGDKDKYEYFKHMQHVMKIILNSAYGVLGLPVYRFYDAENAEAVTTTGVAVIQFAERMANHLYSKELGAEKDYCVYIDTDSLYFSSLPIVQKRFPMADETNEEFMTEKIVELATEVQAYLNQSFDYFASKFLRTSSHRFDIKQEVIARSGLWVAKKRYAIWIISDNGVRKDKLDVKGLDTVRSNFPRAFKNVLKDVLTMVLRGATKATCDEKILAFLDTLATVPINDVAKPTSVKGIAKYSAKDKRTMFDAPSDDERVDVISGTPAHVKAAINYNNLLTQYGLQTTFHRLMESEKIKWVYLKPNPMHLALVAFRGYDDPKEIMTFIRKYADAEKMYHHELESKIVDIYNAMRWSMPSKSAKKFAEFFE